MFTLSSVTSTLSFPALMVTVWEEASFSRFVMMVPVSSTSGSAPCETLFVPLVSLAEIVMSPSSMYHVFAKAGAVKVVSIAAVRTSAAAR